MTMFKKGKIIVTGRSFERIQLHSLADPFFLASCASLVLHDIFQLPEGYLFPDVSIKGILN